MSPNLMRGCALILALAAPAAAQTTTPQAVPAVPSAEAAQLAPVAPAPGAPQAPTATPGDAAPLPTPVTPEAAQSAQEVRAASEPATGAEGGTAASAAGDGAAPAAAEGYAAQKAVYHINGNGGEGGKAYDGALSNLRNHLDAVGDDNADIRVVLHGDGIGLLQKAVEDQGLQGSIVDLKNRGVRFLVCNNTLVGRKISADSLFEVFPEDIVPSGVAELGKLQGKGFAYIKP